MRAHCLSGVFIRRYCGTWQEKRCFATGINLLLIYFKFSVITPVSFELLIDFISWFSTMLKLGTTFAHLESSGENNRMVKTRIYSAGWVVLAMLVAGSAYAGDAPDSTMPKPQYVPGTYRPTIGLLGGYADQNGPIHAAVVYGAEFAYQPWVPFGVGIEVTHFAASKGDLDGGEDYEFYRTAVLVKGTYNFGGEIPVLRNTYIGGKIGVVFDKEDTSVDYFSLEQSRTRFAFAPVIGMDFMVCEKISVGAQFSYLFTVGPEIAYNTFNALAVVKYWF
jgi:opacity protein-like surface antigen